MSMMQLLEEEKRRNLRGEQHKTSTPHPKHAPGWNESLASASEAYVKVCRDDHAYMSNNKDSDSPKGAHIG